MCLGIPARIIRTADMIAECSSRDGTCMIDLSLTGPLPEGAWVLTFLGAAREVIDEARARDIDAALDALAAILRGEEPRLDACFGDLIDRELQLPPHLQGLLPL